MAKRVPLSKAELLKPKTTQIDVDGGILTIRAMSAEYAMGLRGRDLNGTDIFGVIAESLVNESGATFLTTEDVGKIAMATLTQIVKGVFKFNALGEKAVSDAVDELKKTDALTTNLPAS